MHLIYFVLLSFLISTVVGWVAIPRIVIIAKMKRLFDTPNARKVHTDAIPRLGGLSFFPCSMFAFSIALGLRYYTGFELTLVSEGSLIVEFLFMISGMFILFFVGLADDLVGVNFKWKFAVQIFASAVLVFAGLEIRNFGGIAGLHDIPLWFGAILTIFIAVFVVNSFNLIDGIDGLCSGTGSVILTTLGIWFIYLNEYVYAMLAFSMVGVVVTFFQYNVLGHRLKVFMGDTGSLTLGYMTIFLVLKFLSIETGAYPGAVQLYSPVALMIGLLFLPMFDTMRVFVSRVSKGKSPFYPDKNHIHHKLLALGFTHMQNTFTLLFTQICFLGLAILMSEVLHWNVNIIILVDITIGVAINILLNRMLKQHAKPTNRQKNGK